MKIYFKFIILFALFLNFSYAKNISFDFLNNLPRSTSKDYYIWKYLDNNITTKQAYILMSQVYNMNKKLFIKFAKKINNPNYKKILKCYKMKPNEFFKSDADCIKIGFSIYDATKISKQKLKIIENIEQNKYPNFYQSLRIISDKNPFKKLMKSNKDIFFKVFNKVGSAYREKYFNHTIPKNKLKDLISDKKFNQTIKLIVTNPKLNYLQKSLLNINSNKLDANSIFFLGLNALRFNQNKKALKYFKQAKIKYYFRFDKDKVLFWQYLITKNKDYLQKLSKSFEINIYSLYASELLSIPYKKVISNLHCENIKPHENIKNPFAWLHLLNKIDKKETNLTKMAKNFKSCKELPYKAFVLTKLNYKNNYFIMPYKKYINNYNNDEKALIYAIGRQESRFIPSSISSSYALGIMQFMPFLAKATAKQKKIKDFDLDMMFDPKISYTFSANYINYLKKHLNNPLLIAYAYNGGIGFTKRLLKEGFFKKGKYEPFLSMELIPYDESKRYAKKVLANYIIYKKLLGKPIKITTLFQKLQTSL